MAQAYRTEGVSMKLRAAVAGLLLGVLTTTSAAQEVDEGLVGNWKYLRNFTYVTVDANENIFQCRILPDLNVYLATGDIAGTGNITWDPVRFFSLYGDEVTPSGQDWGEGEIELRTRVMFLTGPNASSTGSERREFDRVAKLPTICSYYLSMLTQ